MADDASWVAGAMTQAVPWVTTAGITFGAITTDRVEAFSPTAPTSTTTSAGRTPR